MGEKSWQQELPFVGLPTCQLQCHTLALQSPERYEDTGPGVGSKQVGRLPAQRHMAEHWRGKDSDQYVLILEFLLLCMPAYLLPSS